MKKQLVKQLIEELLEGESETGNSDLPFEVGSAYFIRTVTYHVLGRVKAIKGDFLVLHEASWVADSGRFSQAIERGILNEIEYVGDAIVAINAISDAYPWNHKTPKDTR